MEPTKLLKGPWCGQSHKFVLRTRWYLEKIGVTKIFYIWFLSMVEVNWWSLSMFRPPPSTQAAPKRGKWGVMCQIWGWPAFLYFVFKKFIIWVRCVSNLFYLIIGYNSFVPPTFRMNFPDTYNFFSEFIPRGVTIGSSAAKIRPKLLTWGYF